MRYRVTIAGQTVEVDLSSEATRVDGVAVAAELANVPLTRLRNLIVDNQSFTFSAERGDGHGRWRIALGGNTFDVEVLDERAHALRTLAGGDTAPAVLTVKAPMPGLVVRVNVSAGEAVTAGQGIVVVEAMKMENEVKAPGAGTIARIEVSAGQTVEKGAVLFVLE
jgi:pyruvate carboxylase subunit B